MAITKEEVKNLADLARIEMTEEESQKMTEEVGSILGYVSVVQQFAGGLERDVPILRNVMREDEVTNKNGEYTDDLLGNSPKRDGDYLVVKKIL